MNILGIFLNRELRTGGHRRYLELLEGLGSRGNTVRVILNKDLEYSPAHFQALRISAPYVHRGFPPVALRFRGALGRNLQRVRTELGSAFDCVLIHGETHFLAARLAGRSFGAPVVFGHRSNMVQESLMLRRESRGLRETLRALWELAKYRRYEPMLARGTALIVFQSRYDRDDFRGRTGLPPQRTAVVPGNIGAPRFKPEHEHTNRSDRARKMLFVGNYGLRKGADYLVDAMRILKERGIDGVSLELIGPGERRAEIQERVRVLGLDRIIKVSGKVADPFPCLRTADLVIVPSLFDSFPDSILEALHVGIPVIASRVGGIPEMLIHDELLFKPADSTEIADRIQRCVEDPGYYLQLRYLCSERREAFHFDWPAAWEAALSRFS